MTWSNMIKAMKIVGEMNKKDYKSDEGNDIKDPGDEFVPTTKLKRMACLAHS